MCINFYSSDVILAWLVLYQPVFSTPISMLALRAPSQIGEAARSTSKWLFIVKIHSWDPLIRFLPSEVTHQWGSASHSSVALQRGAKITGTLALNGAIWEEAVKRLSWAQRKREQMPVWLIEDHTDWDFKFFSIPSLSNDKRIMPSCICKCLSIAWND